MCVPKAVVRCNAHCSLNGWGHFEIFLFLKEREGNFFGKINNNIKEML